MEEKRIFKFDFKGRKLTVEVGELAKQANAACLVRYEDTTILSACVMSKNASTAPAPWLAEPDAIRRRRSISKTITTLCSPIR